MGLDCLVLLPGALWWLCACFFKLCVTVFTND